MQAHSPTPAAALLTTLEVADMLRVTPRTLEDWRSSRTGPELPFIRLGRVVRYRRADVENLIAGGVQ